jgi:hypothetical protein
MRPALKQVGFSGILGIPTITANVFFFPANIFTLFDYVCVFNPNFYPWKSSAWQLSAIVSEYYYQPSGGGIHSPVDFQLYWTVPTTSTPYRLLNIPFGVSTTPNWFDLPPADQPYWYDGTEA